MLLQCWLFVVISGLYFYPVCVESRNKTKSSRKSTTHSPRTNNEEIVFCLDTNDIKNHCVIPLWWIKKGKTAEIVSHFLYDERKQLEFWNWEVVYAVGNIPVTYADPLPIVDTMKRDIQPCYYHLDMSYEGENKNLGCLKILFPLDDKLRIAEKISCHRVLNKIYDLTLKSSD